MKQMVGCWGRIALWVAVLVGVLVPGAIGVAGETDVKVGKLIEGMRVGPLKRLDFGVTRLGTLIPALVTDEDLDLRTRKTRVLLVCFDGLPQPTESIGGALKWFYESDDAAEYRKKFLLSAIPVANPDGWAARRVPSNLSGGTPSSAYPPTGTAYSDVKNPEAHYLWRFIGISAPDLVVEIGSGSSPALLVPRTGLSQLKPLVKLGPPLVATRGLASRLPRHSPCRTGPVPAVRLDDHPGRVPIRLAEIFKSGFSGPSPARRTIQKRLARSPLLIASQLARRYGHQLDSVAYIPALALVGRIRLGQLTEDPSQLADVERIVAPYVLGKKPTVPPGRISGSNHSGHLIFSELARVTGKKVYTRLAQNAANLAFDKQGELLEAMPGHVQMSDSVFMACPILVEVGELTGDGRYTRMALRHMKFMLATNLREDGLHAHSPLDPSAWGRGNGFPALGLAWCLSHLGESAAQRKPILAAHRAHLQALIKRQDPTGMWHQVVDHSGSYREFTSTCMITYSIIRGIRRGWLDEKTYGPVVARSWPAIQSRISSDATLVDVCTGTGKQKSLRAYLDRTAILGPDDRGGAMALMVTTEMAAWEQDRKRDRKRDRRNR